MKEQVWGKWIKCDKVMMAIQKAFREVRDGIALGEDKIKNASGSVWGSQSKGIKKLLGQREDHTELSTK